jgi:hypothetical protein
MKMEQTECSETLATKFNTPENIPKENIRRNYTVLKWCMYLCINIIYSLVLTSYSGFHHFFQIYFNVILQSVAGFSECLLSFLPSLKFPIRYFHISHISCHSNFLAVIIPIMCSKGYKSWSFSLQNFVYPHPIFLEFPNIFFSAVLSSTLRLFSSHNSRDQSWQ